jgi:hypothetical protein
MEVYVEPYMPRPELMIVGHGRIAEVLAQLAHTVHFSMIRVQQGKRFRWLSV